MKVQPATQTSDPLRTFFATVVDTIVSHAIFTVDTQGCITNWNKGAEEISGWKRSAVLGTPLSQLYNTQLSNGDTVQKVLEHAAQNGHYSAEVTLQTKMGRRYDADLSVTALHSRDQLVGYIIIAKDTTEQKKEKGLQHDANELLRKEIERRKLVEKALQESNDELDAFASAAGHDLQEPLRMVVSYLQLIKKRYSDKLDTDGIEFLDFAMDGASRMRHLIGDLVEYSRIDTLGKPLRKTDATLVLTKVIDSLKISISEAEVDVTYDQLPFIWSDEVQLHELLQNLIANAVKFGKTGQKRPIKIHVSAKSTATEHIFSVADNGPGIKKKDFETIFLIFKQLGNKLQTEGSGIGLAICRKIVRRHNGRIWVDSEVGKGTTFKFSIPRVKGEL